jgi:hypothetical protein
VSSKPPRRLHALTLRQIELADCPSASARTSKLERGYPNHSEHTSCSVMSSSKGDLNPWCPSYGQTTTVTANGSGTTHNQDSLIRLENSLIARFDSLLGRKKFPVPMRREFPRKLWICSRIWHPLGVSQGQTAKIPCFLPASREFRGIQRRVRT